jgi:fumarate reductase flavoprotein subunit
MLEAANAMVHSALQRKESRGSHQRLDYTARDDEKYLKHSLAYYNGDDTPRIDYLDVVITRLPPGERVYGGKPT